LFILTLPAAECEEPVQVSSRNRDFVPQKVSNQKVMRWKKQHRKVTLQGVARYEMVVGGLLLGCFRGAL
jgi:hypothetical protein